MEHIHRYMQVGTSNDVIFSDIWFQSGSEDWLREHYRAIEKRLSHQLQDELDAKDPARPDLLKTICGEIIMGDAKFTYGLRERRHSPHHLVLTGRSGKRKQWKNVMEEHVDDSVLKYKNYGGLFKKHDVVRAELVVTIERLPLSDSQCRKNTIVGKENTDTKSTYFKGCPDVKPQTPQEKKTLRHLFKEKEHRKMKLNSCESENPAPTLKVKSTHQTSSSQSSRLTEDSLATGGKRDLHIMQDYTESSQKRERQSASEDRDKRGPVTVLGYSAKEPRGKNQDEAAAARPDLDKNMGKMNLKKDEVSPDSREAKHHFKSMTGGRHAVLVSSDSQSELQGIVRGRFEESQESVGKKSQKEGCKERPEAVNKECNTEKPLHKEGRKSRHSKREERTTGSQKEGKKSSKAEAATPAKKSLLSKKPQKNSGEKLKKLLTDCGLSDSDSGGENASKMKGKGLGVEPRPQQSKVDRVSPLHTLQRGKDMAKENKRESLEDFSLVQKRMQKRAERAKKLKTSSSLCKGLLFPSDDDDDEKNTQKGSIMEEYDPSAATKKESDRGNRGYSPAPAKKHVDDDDDAYVPKVRKKMKKEDGAARLVKSHPQPEEYFPTAISPVKAALPVNTLRGRYEEYVPQAITSTAQQQLHTVDYIPTPKKDRTQLYAADIWQDDPYVPEGATADSEHSSRDAAVMLLEEEIKSSRNVKGLQDKHIKYLFYKCMPDMEGIIKKKIYSWRNEHYHKGGKAKRMLTYKVYSSAFTEQQIDLISHMFIDEYVMRRNLTGDYLNQVLLPEFLIRVYMAANGTTHEESDKLMAATPFKVFDVPTHL